MVHNEWIERAATAHSYRRMYELAQNILIGASVPVDIHGAARALADALSPIIDLPIAPSNTLKEARLHFSRLMTALQEYGVVPASDEVETAA